MMTLAAWLHTLDPYLVRFSQDFGLRWYGLSYLAGFAAAYLLLRMLSSTPERPGFTPLPRDRAADAILWLVGGVLVGGRLGYVLIYQQSLLWSVFPEFPWWGVLAINHGGMASHGGIVGAIVAAWLVSRGWKDERGAVRGRLSPQHAFDVIAMLAPAGLMFGRIANFINGELLGRIVSPPGRPGPWWTVQFPQELRGWIEPGVRDLSTHTPDLTMEQQRQLFSLLARLRLPDEVSWGPAIERLIANAATYADDLRPLLSSRHPSQLYQAAAEGIIVGLVVWLAAATPRKPGVVGSWFLISYGVLRIVTEFFRLPDPQFGELARILGLSRGQWLSVAMVAVGVVCLVWTARRDADRMGGWLRRGVNVHGRDGGSPREKA